MFYKIYNIVSQFLYTPEKPNSKVTPVYEYYDYDYARLYELV